jgi:phosphate transport system substrate-binding protein
MKKTLFSRIKNIAVVAVALIGLLLNGCKNQKDKSIHHNDSPTAGTITISVDESFRPVIEEEIKMYENTFPGTKIIAQYKTEADCFKDLLKDTGTRMVIVTRGLNSKEESFYKDSLSYTPLWNDVASDAIVAVVNSASNDTLFTLSRLKKQLSGAMGKKQLFVFDGLNATSTVRFAVDSILKGAKFDSSVVKAVKSNKEVLEYVASDPTAIGFVGISWIGNPEDSAQVNMLKKVKMAYVQCDVCVDSPFVKPTQFGIITKRYPLVRGLYYILKENFTGLGAGFTNFLQSERGQLIFRRAYLGPNMDFEVRKVSITQKL